MTLLITLEPVELKTRMKTSAARTLFLQNKDGLFRYALSLVKRRVLAEELVQDAFVSLLNRPAEKITNSRGYLYLALRSRAYDMLKKDRSEKNYLDTIQSEFRITSSSERFSEIDESLTRCFNELPENQSEVILLKIWNELSFREIASLLNQPQGTVVSRYNYGLEKMRLRMAKEQ